MNQMFGEMMGGVRGAFNVQLRCYSVAMCTHVSSQEKMEEINNGGKILLPASCLDWLSTSSPPHRPALLPQPCHRAARLNVSYPMMFKLVNPNPSVQRATHAGVIEFIADEGKVHLPYWVPFFPTPPP